MYANFIWRAETNSAKGPQLMRITLHNNDKVNDKIDSSYTDLNNNCSHLCSHGVCDNKKSAINIFIDVYLKIFSSSENGLERN